MAKRKAAKAKGKEATLDIDDTVLLEGEQPEGPPKKKAKKGSSARSVAAAVVDPLDHEFDGHADGQYLIDLVEASFASV